MDMHESRGGRGPTILENHKAFGILSNTGPDPRTNTNVPIQHPMFGHYRPPFKTPFKWHFAGGPIMASLYGNWIPSADPEGGTGGPDPPWIITSYMGFYRDPPPPLENVGPPLEP